MFLQRLFNGERMLAILQSKKGAILASFILGLIATLSFAPYNLWPLGVLTLSFALWLVMMQKSALPVFLVIFFYMTGLNAATLSWLNFVMQDFGQMHFVLSWLFELVLASYLALPYALLAYIIYKFLAKNIIAYLLCFLPIGFVAADFVVGYLFTGFPWTYIGYSAINSPFETYAPLIGVRGINLLMVLCAAAIALTITRRYIFLPVAGVIFILGIMFMGTTYTVDSKNSHNFSLVQGNIEQSVKWRPEAVMPTIEKYMNLSEDAFDRRNNVTVWPESAVPVVIESADPFVYTLVERMIFKDSYFITGIQHYNDKKEIFNSIATIDSNTTLENVNLYSKRHLVPFGEFVPYPEIVRKWGKIFNFPMSGFTKGEAIQENIKVKDLELIPAICYEAIFPELIASLDSKDANGILMVSNDSWFGLTRGPLEHLDIARMRSLELQKPMVRVTNSGVTAYIDKMGNVVKSLPQNVAAVLDVEVTGATGVTPYSRFGNTILYILLALCAVFGILIHKKDFDPKNDTMVSMVRP